MSPLASRVPDLRRIEAAGDLAGRAVPQRARQDVDDAVRVIERQHVERAIVRLPRPRLAETLDLRGQIAVREDHALGAARGAARVEHQRAAIRTDGGNRGPFGRPRRRRGHGVVCRGEPDTTRGGQRTDDPGMLRRDDHLRRPAVVEDVLPLVARLLKRQRHRDAAGHPCAPLPRHVGQATRSGEQPRAPLQGRGAGRAARRRDPTRGRRGRRTSTHPPDRSGPGGRRSQARGERARAGVPQSSSLR